MIVSLICTKLHLCLKIYSINTKLTFIQLKLKLKTPTKHYSKKSHHPTQQPQLQQQNTTPNKTNKQRRPFGKLRRCLSVCLSVSVAHLLFNSVLISVRRPPRHPWTCSQRRRQGKKKTATWNCCANNESTCNTFWWVNVIVNICIILWGNDWR